MKSRQGGFSDIPLSQVISNYNLVQCVVPFNERNELYQFSAKCFTHPSDLSQAISIIHIGYVCVIVSALYEVLYILYSRARLLSQVAHPPE